MSPHAAQAQTYGTISPGSLTTTAPTQAYTIDACSVDDGVLLRPTMFSVALDGVAISPSATTPVTVAGCYDAYQITGTVTLVQGQPNRLSTRVVAWGNHSAVDTATYTYQYIKPFVFSNDTWGSTRPGITSTKSFTVRNTGNVTGTITVTSNCSGPLSSCESPSPTSVTLAPMAQQDITVPYHSALTGGAGGLTLHATGVDGTALTDQLTEPLAVDAPVAWLLVTPRPSDGASADVIPGYTVPVPFSLANYGGNYTETVQLVPTCTAAGSPVTCTISPASVDLGIGVTAGVQVLLAAPNAAGVSGTISLVGTVAGTSVTSLGSYTYTTAVNTQHFSLQIATDTVVLAPEKTKTLIGLLSNASPSSDAYSFTATHCDSLAVASCPAPATTGSVGVGGNTPFTLTFRASTHLGQQGAVTLVAASTVVTSSTNVAVIPVRTRDRYVVMPRTASMVLAPGADSAFYFNIEQQEANGTGFQVHLVCPAIVTCYTTAQGTIPVGPGFGFAGLSATYPVTIHAGAAADTGTLIVIATDLPSGTPDSAFYRIAVGTAPPPPPRPHTKPFVTIAAEQGDWRFKDTSKCVADCFDEVTRYSTVPYYSLDTPRALSFQRRRIGYRPAVVLEFDVTDSSSTPADSFSIALRRPNGSMIRLRQQRDTIYYRRGGATNFRITANPEVGQDVSGVYDATAIITGIWSASEVHATEVSVRYVVRNDSASQFGKGWTLEGFQKLQHVTDGKLIFDGSGGWTYFGYVTPSCGLVCRYQHTPGDFSVLRDSIASGQVVGYVRTYPDGSTATFDAAGKMHMTRDAVGDSTIYNYQNTDNLTSVVDPAGKVTSVSFTWWYDDALESPVWSGAIFDPSGRYTRVTDTEGNYVRVTDPDGVQSRGFDGAWFDRALAMQAFTSSPYTSKLSGVTYPSITLNGDTFTPIETLQPRDEKLYANYSHSSLTSVGLVLRADTLLASVTDPKGHVTKYRLDGFGAPTEIIPQTGAHAYVARDVEGRVTREITPRGDTLTYQWRGPYLVQSRDAGTGVVTNIVYSPAVNDSTFTAGHAVSVKTLRNNLVTGTRWFNSHGLLDSARAGPDSSTTVTHYYADAHGRSIQITDPRGHSSYTAYQVTGFQNTDSTYGAGRPSGTRFFYDTIGRVVAKRDPMLNRDTTVYDLMNRITYGKKGGRGLAYYYHARDLFYVLPDGYVGPQYTTNGEGWVTSILDPSSQTQTYEYDVDGNVVYHVNRRGQVIWNIYDAFDRLQSTSSEGIANTFVTDPQGRFTVASNAASIDTVKFDLAGRPDSVVTVRGGRSYTQIISYDAAGRRTGHQLRTGSYVATTGWTFDDRDRLATITEPLAPAATTYRYDQEGALSYTASPGLVLDLASSGAHAPNALMYHAGVLSREYAYEATSGLISDRIRPDSSRATRYLYDGLGQLQHAIPYGLPDSAASCGQVVEATGEMAPICHNHALALETWHELLMTYDPFGNRTDHGGAAYSNNRQTAFDGMAFSYDLDGNLSQKTLKDGTLQRFTWTADGLLTRVLHYASNGTTLLDTAAYAYDGLGRRVKKTTSAHGTISYLYDGDNLLAQLDAAGDIAMQYTYKPGIDQPHSVRYNGHTYYVATEAPGSVSGLTNEAGVPAALWDYDVWGVPRVLLGADSIPMPLRFAAREYDVETGLYYNRARYYDPQTGRFISEDPLGLAGGVNQYTYAGNNPVNSTDPSGLLEVCGPAQLGAGWKNITSDAGLPECQAPDIAQLAAMGVTAEGSASWAALLFRLSHSSALWGGFGGQPVELGVPSWIGGPAGAANASAGVRALFSETGLADNTIVGIRNTLKANGFLMRISDNGIGYLYENPARVGEEVRLMRAQAGWYMRVKLSQGLHLGQFGAPGSDAVTHIPIVNH